MGKMALILKQFDLISQRPNLLINRSERVKSVWGALLTMLLIASSLGFSIVSLQKLFDRTDVKLFTYQYPETNNKDTTMKFQDFPLLFSVIDTNKPNTILTDFAKNFDFSININNQKNEQVANYKYVTCDKVELSENLNFDDIDPKNYFCIDLTNIDEPVLNTKGSDDHNYLQINLMIKNTTNSYIQSMNNTNLEFVFGYIDYYYDIHNYNDPIYYFPNFIYNEINLKTTKLETSLNLINQYFSTDVGYVFQDYQEISLLRVDQQYRQRKLPFNPKENVLMSMNLKLNSYYKVINQRSYYKFQGCFADIGGVFYFLYLISLGLNILHSHVSFYLSIDSHTKMSHYVQKVKFLYLYII
jgi:hypothetical protein